jgi:hypothetical protein
MIPPRDTITAHYPAAAPAIDAATVLSRLAAGGRWPPGSHPSEPRPLPARFIGRRAETITKIPLPTPRRLAANRHRLVASTTSSAQSP